MSNWTHVAGIIRVDYLKIPGVTRDIDFEEEIGRELTFDDIWDETVVYEEYESHPQSFLPSGSEGSLKMSVWANPDDSHLSAYTVSIFGDLRDHHNEDEIIEWFKAQCNKFLVRQAVITVYNEYHDEPKTWTFEGREDK